MLPTRAHSRSQTWQADLKAIHQRAPVQRLASRLEAEDRLRKHRLPLRLTAALRRTLSAHLRLMLLRPGKALQRRLRKHHDGSSRCSCGMQCRRIEPHWSMFTINLFLSWMQVLAGQAIGELLARSPA